MTKYIIYIQISMLKIEDTSFTHIQVLSTHLHFHSYFILLYFHHVTNILKWNIVNFNTFIHTQWNICTLTNLKMIIKIFKILFVRFQLVRVCIFLRKTNRIIIFSLISMTALVLCTQNLYQGRSPFHNEITCASSSSGSIVSSSSFLFCSFNRSILNNWSKSPISSSSLAFSLLFASVQHHNDNLKVTTVRDSKNYICDIHKSWAITFCIKIICVRTIRDFCIYTQSECILTYHHQLRFLLPPDHHPGSAPAVWDKEWYWYTVTHNINSLLHHLWLPVTVEGTGGALDNL